MTYANFYFHGAADEGDAYFAALETEQLAREEMAARCSLLCPVVMEGDDG